MVIVSLKNVRRPKQQHSKRKKKNSWKVNRQRTREKGLHCCQKKSCCFEFIFYFLDMCSIMYEIEEENWKNIFSAGFVYYIRLSHSQGMCLMARHSILSRRFCNIAKLFLSSFRQISNFSNSSYYSYFFFIFEFKRNVIWNNNNMKLKFNSILSMSVERELMIYFFASNKKKYKN